MFFPAISAIRHLLRYWKGKGIFAESGVDIVEKNSAEIAVEMKQMEEVKCVLANVPEVTPHLYMVRCPLLLAKRSS